MPDKKTIQAAKRDKKEGKSASTQAGEFVRKEIDTIRQGKHGARNTKQAIAIGLSEARRAGVDLKPTKKGTVSEKTKANAKRDTEKGRKAQRDMEQGKEKTPVSPTRSRASVKALQKESTAAASPQALSQQATAAARKRSAADRSAAARQAVDTKGPKVRAEAAKQAAHTRAMNNRGQ